MALWILVITNTLSLLKIGSYCSLTNFSILTSSKMESVNKGQSNFHLTFHIGSLLGFMPDQLKSSRRVIIEYLKKSEIDIRGICSIIMGRQTPKDWDLLFVRAKEREMKLELRLSAMMVLEMTIYFVLQKSTL